MKLLFPCLALLIHFTTAQIPAPSFTAGLNEIPQFTDEPAIQKLISDDAELDRFKKTFYKSDNLPSTCGFQFSISSSVSFIWEINCLLPQARHSSYVKCVEGELTTDNERVRIGLDHLRGNAKSEGLEACPLGKQSLAAVDEFARLVPSNDPKTIKLDDVSTYELFRNLDYTRNGKNEIRTPVFDVLLSPEIIKPSQVPSLGYYGKYGYRISPDLIKPLTEAVRILNGISIIDIRKYLQSDVFDVKTRLNIKSILKKHNKFKNFVSLLKHLYGRVVRLSENVEKTNKELLQTMDDIVDLVSLLNEIEDGKILKALLTLIDVWEMIKTIS